MTDLRATVMHGFTCAVALEQPAVPQLQIGGIAVGADGAGDERRISIALRHADGTMLVGRLTEDGINRLALMMAELVGDDGEPVSAPAAIGAVLH